MVTVGVLARLEAKPGKEEEVASFLAGALPARAALPPVCPPATHPLTHPLWAPRTCPRFASKLSGSFP